MCDVHLVVELLRVEYNSFLRLSGIPASELYKHFAGQRGVGIPPCMAMKYTLELFTPGSVLLE